MLIDRVHEHTRAGALAPGDVTRGINHSRIITGPPVRVTSVRRVGALVRVGYVIIGDGGHGWRDVDPTRGVTVERRLPAPVETCERP